MYQRKKEEMQVKPNRKSKIYEHRVNYTSTRGEKDVVYVKSNKFPLSKKEACKLATKKRKGTGYKCKKVNTIEIMNF